MMMRNGKRKFVVIAAIAALVVLLVALPAGVAADTLFEDDFQTGTIEATSWPNTNGATIEGSYFVQLHTGSSTNAYIISRTIDATGMENIVLSYDRQTTHFGTSITDYFYSEYSTNGGSSWTTLETVSANDIWTTKTFDLPTNPNIIIRFRLDDNGFLGWGYSAYAYVDNVIVTGEYASLNVTKTAKGEEPYYPGQTITYNITVCNNGNQTLTNVRVNDPLLGFDHVFGTLAPGECTSTEELNYMVVDADACIGWINNTVYVYNGTTLFNETSENVRVNCSGIPDDHIDLFFLVDASNSLDDIEFQLQLDGIADAISNTSIVPRDGSIAVALVLFETGARLEIPLTPITDETIDQLVSDITNITHPKGWTYMWEAFDVATANIPCCNDSGRQVIDLSTDGVPAGPRGYGTNTTYVRDLTMTARNNSILAGFDVVNVLGVGDGIDPGFMKSLTYGGEPGSWEEPPGFYDYAEDFTQFRIAMEKKILRETKSTIGDFVWCDCCYPDVNKIYNGIQDEGEPGVPDVTVNLYDNSTGTGTLVKTTITNDSGYYNFTNVPAGSYYLEFVYTTTGLSWGGWTLQDADGSDESTDSDVDPSTGKTVTFSLAGGVTDLTWDAGLYVAGCDPIPELDTVVLFSTGLLTLAGYFVVVRRRRLG